MKTLQFKTVQKWILFASEIRAEIVRKCRKASVQNIAHRAGRVIHLARTQLAGLFARPHLFFCISNAFFPASEAHTPLVLHAVAKLTAQALIWCDFCVWNRRGEAHKAPRSARSAKNRSSSTSKEILNISKIIWNTCSILNFSHIRVCVTVIFRFWHFRDVALGLLLEKSRN